MPRWVPFGVSETPTHHPDTDLPEQMRVRHEKRERLLSAGRQAYPVAVDRTHTLEQVREQWGHLETGEETQDVVGVAGRVIFIRNTGSLASRPSRRASARGCRSC